MDPKRIVAQNIASNFDLSEDTMPSYQDKQRETIRDLQSKFQLGLHRATLVEPVQDYERDTRKLLGIFSFPPDHVIDIVEQLQSELKATDARQFYIPRHALHLTIKNVRTIADPPNFTQDDVEKIAAELPAVITKCSPLEFLGEGLLITPTSVSIPLLSGARFGELVVDLDKMLKKIGVPDDKTYSSGQIFFANITIARFVSTPRDGFFAYLTAHRDIQLPSFVVNEASLVTSNLAFSDGCVEEFVRVSFAGER